MPEKSPEDPAPAFPHPKHLNDAMAASLRRYWRANVKIMVLLLGVWAVVGLGCGILLADVLTPRLGGYPLGFWFAQQGSIIVFVLLILIYAIALNKLDAKHHAELRALEERAAQQAAGHEAGARVPRQERVPRQKREPGQERETGAGPETGP